MENGVSQSIEPIVEVHTSTEDAKINAICEWLLLNNDYNNHLSKGLERARELVKKYLN